MTVMRTARAGTMLNYYVYYRVVIAETARVRAVLEAVQAALGEDTGVRGRLLRCSDDPSTWMEIYEGVADPPRFEAALERSPAATQTPPPVATSKSPTWPSIN